MLFRTIVILLVLISSSSAYQLCVQSELGDAIVEENCGNFMGGVYIPVNYSSLFPNTWEVVSGSCELDADKYGNAYVLLSGDCTIQASFTRRTGTFRFRANEMFTINAASVTTVQGLRGVIIHFKREDLISYGSDVFLFSSYKPYGIVYRSKSQAFNPNETHVDGLDSKGRLGLIFENSYDNDVYYLIPQETLGKTSGLVQVQQMSYVSMVVKTSGEGKASFVGSGAALHGDTYTLKVEPEEGWSYTGWTSSSCEVEKSTTDPMTFTFISATSNSCTITANFEHWDIYPITTSPQTFTFNKSASLESGYYKLRTVFNAKEAGIYVIQAKSNGNPYYIDNKDDISFSATSGSSFTKNLSKTLTMEAGSSNYFLFRQSEANGSDTIQLVAKRKYALQIDSLATGEYASKICDPDSNYRISAVVPNGKIFDKWVVEKGTCSVANATSATSTVKLSTDCTVKASFKFPPILEITETPRAYNLAGEGYLRGSDYCGNMRFVPTTSGTYRLNYTLSVSKYLYLYNLGEKTDFSYVFATTSYSKAGNYTLFLGEVDSDGHYFVFRVTDTSQVITANVVPTYKIRLENDAHSSAKFDNGLTYDSTHVNGETLSIDASSDKGYRFSSMKVTSGKCTLSSTTSQSATLTVNGNCTVKVLSEEGGSIYPISTTASKYNYADHRSEVNSYYGIRTVFTPDKDGVYTVKASGKNPVTIVGYDGTFMTSNSMNGSAFSAKADTSYYFFVRPSSNATSFSLDKNDTLKIWAVKNVTVTASVSGTGSVTIDGAVTTSNVKHVAGDSILLEALPTKGFRFDHWGKVSGSCTIRNTNGDSTYVKLDGDCSVKAYFVEADIYKITDVPRTFHFLEDGGVNDLVLGIRTYFDVPEPGTYKFVISSNVGNVGNDIFADDSFGKREKSNVFVVTYTETGRHYPFIYLSQAYSKLVSAKDSVVVSVQRTCNVRVNVSGGGIVYINGYNRNYDSTAVVGDSLKLTSNPGSADRLLNWKVTSGSCTIANEKAKNTILKVNGDCNIAANFGKGVVHEITDIPAEYSILGDYYSTAPDYGVRFIFEAPADGQYGIVTSLKKVAYSVSRVLYSDETFNSKAVTNSFNDLLIDTLTMSKGEKKALIIKGVATIDSADEFSIHYVDLKNTKHYSITCVSDSLSDCIPSGGYKDILPNVSYSVTASAKLAGYVFDSWKVKSGTASISNKSTTKTLVSVTSDVTLQALYKKGPIHTVSTTKQSFTYYQDRYSDRVFHRSDEVALKWVAPDTGTYVLDIEDPGGDIYVFSYGTNFTLSASYLSYNFSSKKSIPISATQKGAVYYWTVAPYSASYNSRTFTAVVKKAYNLQLKADEHGVISGTSNFALPAGVDTTISAYGNIGYLFDNWIVSSGKATIDNPVARTTKVSVTSNAVVEANFKKGPVQKISTTEETFTFNEDKFTDNYSYDNYVAMSWTPSKSGQYFLEVESLAAVYMYDFGSDKAFAKSLASNYSYLGGLKYVIDADSGVTQYFMVGPYYLRDSTKSFNVKVSRGYTLTVKGDSLMGKVAPAGTIPLVSGRDTIVSASSYVGYFFDNWSVVSGKVTIADSTAAATKVSITSDASIKAKFHKGKVQKIDTTFKTFTFNKDQFTDNADHLYDVALTWTPPDSEWYYLVIESPNNDIQKVYLWDYLDSSFARSAWSTPAVPSTNLFRCTSKEPMYWSVQRYSSADTSKSFSVKIERASQLTVTSDGHGNVTPTEPQFISESNEINISATSKFGYKFNKWTVVSGSPVIGDSTAPSTYVISKKDATVKAVFTKGTVQSLEKTAKSFTFAEDYYTDTTGSKYFVTMSWTAPDTNWYYMEIESTKGTGVTLYDYRTKLSWSNNSGQKKDSSFYVVFQGVKDSALYWALGPTYARDSLKSFSAKIDVPYVMTVESDRHGVTMPTGAVVMPAVHDTTVMAYPYGGYQFDNWTVTKGEVDIENPVGEETVVTPKDSVTAIKANYVMDLTTVPKLKIEGISSANHPEICSIVSVVDSNNGRSIVDLDTSDFVLFEDGKSLPARVTVPNAGLGISVVFVVDESGSVDDIQKAVREYVTRFANEMQPYDRGAIIGYVDTVRIVQNYTSNRDSLLMAIERLRFTGGCEDIAVGAYHGIELVGELTGAKAVIVFSDGESDHKQIAASKVISLANQFGTSIYSISFGKSADHPTISPYYGFDILQDISKETGGRYYETVGVSETRAILAEIRGDLQARYMVCHTTPDTIIDGDTHLVRIDASYRGKATSDTGSWYESFLPPKVRLTDATSKLVGKTLKMDSLEISVIVSSRISQKSVIASIRKNGNNTSYSTYRMTNEKDSLWTVTVPSSYLVAPGLDFYVVATDSLNQTGSTPADYPASIPHTIYIENDPTEIKFLTDGCVDTTVFRVLLSFEISDNDGMNFAKFYYRNSNKKSFDSLYMSRVSNYSDTWNVAIITEVFGGTDLEYYIEAFDNLGVKTRWGTTKNHTLKGCKVDRVPDVKDVLEIVNAKTSKNDITRATEAISLTLKSQDFTKNTDTLTVKLSCLLSGDIESNIKVVEQKSGYYVTPKDISKNEYAPKRGDGKISCNAVDTLVAEFKDPVYETVTRDTVAISDEVKITYKFLASDGKTNLDSAETSDSVNFIVRVTAPSKSMYDRDTLKLKVFTDTGDTIRVYAVETDVFSMEYEYATTFYYVDSKKDMTDKYLEAVYDDANRGNRIKIQAVIAADKSLPKDRDSLIVFSEFSGADYAEIYDSDLDGTADSVRVHFIEPLEENISNIDSVFWNAAGKKWRGVSKNKMHLGKNRQWVETVLEKPFDYGLTSADEKKPPYLRLKKSADARSQKVALRDKVGPVPAYAEKRPGRVPTVEYLNMSTDIPLDTLYVKMSEPVFSKDKEAWKKLFRYSKSCADTASMPLLVDGEPEVSKDSLEWRFVLKNRNLLVGSCLRSAPAAKFADSLGNIVGVGGVKIEGFNSDIYLYKVDPTYKLGKNDKTPKWIPPGKDKWVEVPDSLQTVLIASIAPYKANVYIYDNLANVVTDFSQTFTQEEMEMSVRGNDTDRSKIGFLHWNMRSKDGRKVGTGVYIWYVDFIFDDGHKEYRIIKTGLRRRD